MLSTVFSKEKTQSIIDVMPDEMIVWKVVTDGEKKNEMNGYYPYTSYERHAWNSAWAHGDSGLAVYNGKVATDMSEGVDVDVFVGYHSFVKRESAGKYMASGRPGYCWAIVSAKVLRSDITAMGSEDCGLAVVTSRIIMPTYPNTDITKELSEAPLIEDCVEVMELMAPVS